MTNSHTWTDNAMEAGVASCNPDIANENFQFLKEETEAVPDKVNPDKAVLTAGSSNTLQEGKWHTLANGSSTTPISMFTSSDTDKTQIAFVNFTTSTTTQPTFNTAVFDYTPTWDTAKHNLVTIFTEDGTNYAANHRVLGY